MTLQAVIIGAGQAGAQAAQSLRQAGFAGRIVLVGDEPHLPYQRPPLSKAYLQGDLTAERLSLRPAAYFEKESIDIRPGVRALAIDRRAARLSLSDGTSLAYDRLLIATGAPPRRLTCPGADLQGVHYLRTIADSDALRPHLSCGGRMAIIGGGYIGLEVAAVARKAGVEVTLLEAMDRVLARVAGRELSSFYEKAHRDAGVELRLNARVVGFEGRGRIERVLLADGGAIPCSAVLVGIGAIPATEIAEAAGLAVENGVVVDDRARTGDPAIFAAGDVANFPSPLYGRRMRLESVPNAIEQAKVAGAGMAGHTVVYDAVPWFWSDQYDLKLQSAGLGESADNTILRGDPAAKRFSLWSLRQGRLIAADCVNDPAAFATARKLIAAKATPAPERLADPGIDYKSLG
jgi:3-phenylpropionate/trans-cinnamate dioxygenase ferredoxin reductase subunit